MDQKIEFRLSQFEKYRIKFLAERFAGGNISKWCKFAALNMPPDNIEDKWEMDTVKTPSKKESAS